MDIVSDTSRFSIRWIKPCRWCFLLRICTIFMSFCMQELMQQMCIRSLKNIMLLLLWMMLSFPGFFIWGYSSGSRNFWCRSGWVFIGVMLNLDQCGTCFYCLFNFTFLCTIFSWIVHRYLYTYLHIHIGIIQYLSLIHPSKRVLVLYYYLITHGIQTLAQIPKSEDPPRPLQDVQEFEPLTRKQGISPSAQYLYKAIRGP